MIQIELPQAFIDGRSMPLVQRDTASLRIIHHRLTVWLDDYQAASESTPIGPTREDFCRLHADDYRSVYLLWMEMERYFRAGPDYEPDDD